MVQCNHTSTGIGGVKKISSDNEMFTGVLNNKVILVALYVDDLLIPSPCLEPMEKVKDALALHFSMKVLGQVSHFLGIEIECSRGKGMATLSQAYAIERVLENFNMMDCCGHIQVKAARVAVVGVVKLGEQPNAENHQRGNARWVVE